MWYYVLHRMMPIGMDKDMMESTGLDKKLRKVMLKEETKKTE